MKRIGSFAVTVAVVYAVVGALWIFFSDAAVERMTSDPETLTLLQRYKGWGFVLGSTFLVFWLSRRALGEQVGLIRELRQTALVFECAHEGALVTDHRGRIISANPAFERMSALSRARLDRLDLGTLLAERHDEDFRERIRQALAERGYWNGEIWLRRADGGESPYQVTATDIGADRGGVDKHAWVFTDISELKRAQEDLRQRAYFDPLTDLPNRLMAREELGRRLGRAERDVDRVDVLFIDLDRFRNVNDSFGFEIGDDLLLQVSRRLKEGLAENAGLAHMGGDEFLVQVHGLRDAGGAADLAAGVLERLAAPFTLANGIDIHVSASIGISRYPEDAATATRLIQYANAAMYRAKRRGRGSWEYFSTSIVHSATRWLKLDASLRSALEKGEFTLNYEPIIAAGDQYRVSGLEALLRWRDADGRSVPPSEFIPAAEETGLIIPLGDWALEEACRQAVRWQDESLGSLPVAVNLSARQFQAGNLAETVERVLDSTGLPAELLQLEITESLLMEQIEAGRDVLQRLRRLGVGVSLDDFGTGYSSLSYVKKLDLDTIKIDRSFIRDLADSESDRELVAAIIGMARCLHLKVVAEGVETVEQLDILTAMNCDSFQGRFFSSALPAGEVPEIARALRQVRPGSRPVAS